MVPVRIASSGMALAATPLWIEPTVITAGSIGSVRREMICCRAVMTEAAATTGSAVAWGYAPCPPRPRITKVNSSDEAFMMPGNEENSPARIPGCTCAPITACT